MNFDISGKSTAMFNFLYFSLSPQFLKTISGLLYCLMSHANTSNVASQYIVTNSSSGFGGVRLCDLLTSNSDDSRGSDVPEVVPRVGDSFSVFEHDDCVDSSPDDVSESLPALEAEFDSSLLIGHNSRVNQERTTNRFQKDDPEYIADSTHNSDDSCGSDVPELVPRGGFQEHDLFYIPFFFFLPIPE